MGVDADRQGAAAEDSEKGGEEEERWRERVETSYNIASEMVIVVVEGSMGYSIFISVERQSSSEAGGRGGSFLDKKEW